MKKIQNFKNGLSINGKPLQTDFIWDDIRAFLAIARCKTLSAAAKMLKIGIATLSRRIERLENALKVPLFVRHQSGYQLTVEGVDLIEKAEALEEAALALSAGSEHQRPLSGKICLATAENLASALILPALPKFRASYPLLTIELITDIATTNIHRREADLALRMIKPTRGNLKLRRLGTLGYGLYGSAEYFRLRKNGNIPGNYAEDTFITWGEMQAHLPAAQWIEHNLHGRQPTITTTSVATQIAAATAGLGLVVIPHFLAVDTGLVCIDTNLGFDQTLYLVMQSDLAQSPRIRAMADFLSDLIISNRARLQNAAQSQVFNR